ncbi:MAG: hypothetical protein AAF730_07515 [Bacteroidota bacterium]
MPYERKYHSDLLGVSWRDDILTWPIPGVADALEKEAAAQFGARLTYAERQRLQAGEYEPMLRLGAERNARRGRRFAMLGAAVIALYAGSVALSMVSGFDGALAQGLPNLVLVMLSSVMTHQALKTHSRRARLLNAVADLVSQHNESPAAVVEHHRAAIIAQVEREERR